jgi:hypothetical protein
MEGMLDNLSQPVAFATAPLDFHNGAESSDTDREDTTRSARGSGSSAPRLSTKDDSSDEFDMDFLVDQGLLPRTHPFPL